MTDSLQGSIKAILRKPYARRLTPETEGGYSASIQEFPGCFAEGNTADEALRNLDAAAAAWIEVSLAHGREIREPVSFDGYSGKIALRIPRGLHQQVAELAGLEECSVNQLLVSAISEYVGACGAIRKIRTALRESQHALPPHESYISAGIAAAGHFEIHQDHPVYYGETESGPATQKSAPKSRVRAKNE